MTGHEINIELFYWINGLPHFDRLDRLILAITAIEQKEASIVLGVVFLCGVLFRQSKLWISAVILLLAFLFLSNLVDDLKPQFNKPRPYETLQNVRVMGGKAAGSSFPSSAAALAGMFFSYVYLITRKRLALWIAIIVLVGVFRVYEGIHYPGDILAGWFLGFCTAWAASFLYRWVSGVTRFSQT